MERPFEQWKSKEVARLLALVETERRYYQELVANLPVSVAVLNPDRTLVAANRAFRQAFGLRGSDLRVRSIDQLLPSADLSARIQSVLDTGLASHPLVIERTVAATAVAASHLSVSQRLRVTVQPIRDWEEDSDSKVLLVIEDMAESAAALPAPAAQATLAAPSAPVPAPPSPVATTVVAPAPKPAATPSPSPATAAAAVVPAKFPDPLPCVIWSASVPGRNFTSVSGSAKALLGIDPSEWLNTPNAFSERIHPEDRERTIAFYDLSLQTPGFHSAEFRLSRPERWYRETVLSGQDRGESLTGVITDITARRALEEQMLQAQRLDAIGALAGRIAHDINNPLMIVNGYAEDLAQSFSADDVRSADMRQIQEAGKRIGEVTGYLHSASRKQFPEGVAIDVNAELSKVVEHMRAAAGEYLKADYVPRAQSLSVLAESGQLEAVILELSAALVEGGGESAHLILTASPAQVTELVRPDQPLAPGHYVEISIVNQSQAAPHLSSRMFEALLPGKDQREAGPALAKTFKTVQDWGGVIHTSPAGNEVRVYLKDASAPEPPAAPPPVAPPVKQHSPAPTPSGPEPTIAKAEAPTLPETPLAHEPPATPVSQPLPEPIAAMPVLQPKPAPVPEPVIRKTRVLIVEDEPGIRALMRKILQREGYDVLEAGSGPEAMELLNQKGPADLLITDILMPGGMTGRDLATRVQEMDQFCSILYMSGFTAETGVETGQFPPGSYFLQKPFTLGSLLRKVNEVLAAAPHHPMR